MRPPSATVDSDEAAQVWNEDLGRLSQRQLLDAMRKASSIAARDPRRCVWRGLEPISVREWADERIGACMARLVPQPPMRTTRDRPKGRA